MAGRKKALPVIPCGVAIIRDKRRFIIAQRKDDDTFGSFWEFPGGKKEDNETFEECVAREVKEEIGIDVEVHEKFASLRRRYHERIVWLNFFLCTRLSGEPKPIDCKDVVWADLDELLSYNFPPANERVIGKLKARFG